MRTRIAAWIRASLFERGQEWVCMAAIWAVVVLGVVLVGAFLGTCRQPVGGPILQCVTPAQQVIIHWPWLPVTALMFLPGMWLWKTWRYTCARGAASGWAWAAGLFCVPWLLMVVAIVTLIVLAAVIYESFLNGETWANAATWGLTKVKVHEDEYGVLYRGLTSWGPVLKVKVADAKGDHWLTIREAKTAQEAVASTFGLTSEDYKPAVES
jgi:hypothetical protein